MYEISFSPDVIEDLESFRKFDQVKILASIETHLGQRPTVETRNQKRLRPDHVGQCELRVGAARVFYDVDDENTLVRIAAIGYKKRDKLYFRGQEHEP